MRRITFLIPILLVTSIGAHTQTKDALQQATGGTLTIEEVADRVFRAEAGLTARMRAFKPIVESKCSTWSRTSALARCRTGTNTSSGNSNGTMPKAPR